MLGILPLSSAYVVVLFDSGASHSFVSTSFVHKYHLHMENGNEKWHVQVPTERTQVTNLICRDCPFQIGNWDLRANLIVLDIQDFDAILGMDWLSKHYAFIDCKDKKVIFEIPRKEVFIFQGERSHTPTLISAAKVCSLIRKNVKLTLSQFRMWIRRKDLKFKIFW